MDASPLRNIVPRLRRILAPRNLGSDADLIARFVATNDEAAFAELVVRHGPIVRGVCRRALGPDASDDAFQATFLILARKAGSIRRPAAIGSWLYGVAHRVCRRALTQHERRERNERRVLPAQSNAPDPASAAVWDNLLAVLDEELARLPDQLRAPLVLCYINGQTQDEAATQLGWSFGTFRRRLGRARELLRARMESRDATLSAALFATLLAADAVTATVPLSLVQHTTELAVAYLAGGTIAPSILTLVQGGISVVSFPKLTTVAVIAVLLGGLTVGAGAWLKPDEKKTADAKPNPPQQMTDKTPLPAGAIARLGEANFNHGAGIHNVLVPRDGLTLLTQGDRSVRIWDAKTGNSLGSIDVPDGGPGFWTSSLTPDGQTLLTTRRNGTAQVWIIAERKLLRSFPLAAPPFDVGGNCDAVHAPDGSAIAVVTADGSLRVCDVASGRERDDLRSHSDGITAVAFTTNSKSLLVAKHGGNLEFWDVASGHVMSAPGVKGNGNLIVNGRLPAIPSGPNVPGTPVEAQKIALTAGEPPMAAIIAAPKPKEGGEDRSKLFLYSWSDSSNVGVAPSSSGIIVGDAQTPLAITPDGRYVLANNPPRMYLGQWDVRSHRNIRQYTSGAYAAAAIAFTADGRSMITADSRLHFWDWKTGQPAENFVVSPRRFIGEFQSFVVSGDGQTAVMAESDGSLVARELTTGRTVRRFEFERDSSRNKSKICALALSGNQERVAAVIESPPVAELGFPSATICVWNFKTGEIQYRIATLPYRRLAFSPDGKSLAASSTDGNNSARIWEMATGLERPGPLDDLKGMVVDYSSDGTKLLVVFPMQVRVSIYSADYKSYLENWTASLPGQLRRWEYTPDFKCFAFAWTSGNGESGITFFRDQKKQSLPLRFDRQNQFPIIFALSADGAKFAGIGPGESPHVTIWDVPSGRELRRFDGLHGQAGGLAFTPDGKRLVAGSTDGTLLVFDAEP